jgi:hypothetical protein
MSHCAYWVWCLPCVLGTVSTEACLHLPRVRTSRGHVHTYKGHVRTTRCHRSSTRLTPTSRESAPPEAMSAPIHTSNGHVGTTRDRRSSTRPTPILRSPSTGHPRGRSRSRQEQEQEEQEQEPGQEQEQDLQRPCPHPQDHARICRAMSAPPKPYPKLPEDVRGCQRPCPKCTCVAGIDCVQWMGHRSAVSWTGGAASSAGWQARPRVREVLGVREVLVGVREVLRIREVLVVV